jgi:hypothetical protein
LILDFFEYIQVLTKLSIFIFSLFVFLIYFGKALLIFGKIALLFRYSTTCKLMQINKDQFRDLIEQGKIGPALNQLSDVMHFLNDDRLRSELEEASEMFNRYQDNEDAGGGSAEGLQPIQKTLLDILERLPEAFDPADAGGEGRSGGACLLALLAIVFASLAASVAALV